MSIQEPEQPDRYISRSGVIWSSRQLERGAWEHSMVTDPTDEPVVIGGTPYYPVTAKSTFLMEYTGDGEECQDIVVGVTESRSSVTGDDQKERDSIQVRVTFLRPEGKKTRVLRSDAIHTVEPIDAITDWFPLTSRTEQGRAVEMEKYAALHSQAVEPSRIIALLDSRDERTVRAGVAALRHIIDDRGDECISAIHHLRKYLLIHDESIARDSLYCLARLAQLKPRETVFAASTITEYLTHPSQNCRENALKACEAIASTSPESIVGDEQALSNLATTGSRTERMKAVTTLAEIAVDHPHCVEPYLSEFIPILSQQDQSNAKIAVMSTAGRIAIEMPRSVLPHIDEIAGCLSSGNEELAASAAATMYAIATEYDKRVSAYTDDVVQMLNGDSSYVKLNATGVLARIAKTHSDTVASHSDAVIRCLTSDDEGVRLNACHILERLGSEVVGSTESLEEVALTDPDDDVQLHAFRALDEITSK